jgi:uncharacterized protein (TIGR03437 family)
VTFGQIAAVFSNGDPALRLTLADPASGLYAATWTPRNPSQQVAVTLTALAPGLASASQQLIGVVTPNGAPLLSPNSTQSLFNPQAGGSVAPGGIVQISGTGFSSQSTVTIGGLSAPVTAATANTITAEVPTELAPGTLAQVIVTENGATSMPDTVFLAAVSPGISTVAHADGMPVTESSPAAPGEALTLTAAGLGVTSPPVPDGVPSPSTPLATVVDSPSMTLDGSSVSITSAVLQAGTVGIYQVGFIVPQNARSGDLTLVLTQPGNMANAAVVPVRGQ